jgi:hypothetical protein
MSAKRPPKLHIASDRRMNPALADEVATLRGAMFTQAERIALPSRFDAVPHTLTTRA